MLRPGERKWWESKTIVRQMQPLQRNSQPKPFRRAQGNRAKKNGTGAPDEEVSKLQKASWEAEPRPVNAESTAAVLPNTQSLAISLQEKPSQDVPETMVEEQLPGATADTATYPLEKYYVEQSKFHCKACSFACSRLSTIRSHVEDGCRGSEQFCCPLCSKPFRSKRAVKIHQLEGHHVRIKHEGEKPHKCPYCEFSTTRRYRLDAHQSLHTGVGRIACPTCGQTFGTNSKLRIHRT
uniref:Zinc finger protein 142 n=1 Tax=Podarcis muralis TaxID=64176 RepID=A0A670K238_PODMU